MFNYPNVIQHERHPVCHGLNHNCDEPTPTSVSPYMWGSQKMQECIDLPWMVPFVPWTKLKLLPFLVAKNAGVYRLPCLAHKILSLSYFNKHLEAQTCARVTHNSHLHKHAIMNSIDWSAVVLDQTVFAQGMLGIACLYVQWLSFYPAWMVPCVHWAKSKLLPYMVAKCLCA